MTLGSFYCILPLYQTRVQCGPASCLNSWLRRVRALLISTFNPLCGFQIELPCSTQHSKGTRRSSRSFWRKAHAHLHTPVDNCLKESKKCMHRVSLNLCVHILPPRPNCPFLFIIDSHQAIILNSLFFFSTEIKYTGWNHKKDLCSPANGFPVSGD